MSKTENCSTILIAGRANAGKSTLLNRLLGRKVSVTSRRPQTTINRILGVKDIEKERLKIFFIDTPGLYPNIQESKKSSKLVYSCLNEVNLVLFVADISKWSIKDIKILEQIKSYNLPTMLILNKIDLLKNEQEISSLCEDISRMTNFFNLFPVSSTKGKYLTNLEEKIISYTPRRRYTQSDKKIMLQNEISVISEILREKFMRVLQKELAHIIRVQIISFQENLEKIRIFSVVWVERLSQKFILIGKDGSLIKAVCTRARKSVEAIFKKNTFIKVKVKVEGK